LRNTLSSSYNQTSTKTSYNRLSIRLAQEWASRLTHAFIFNLFTEAQSFNLFTEAQSFNPFLTEHSPSTFFNEAQSFNLFNEAQSFKLFNEAQLLNLFLLSVRDKQSRTKERIEHQFNLFLNMLSMPSQASILTTARSSVLHHQGSVPCHPFSFFYKQHFQCSGSNMPQRTYSNKVLFTLLYSKFSIFLREAVLALNYVSM
jgi:hypothetical protein